MQVREKFTDYDDNGKNDAEDEDEDGDGDECGYGWTIKSSIISHHPRSFFEGCKTTTDN